MENQNWRVRNSKKKIFAISIVVLFLLMVPVTPTQALEIRMEIPARLPTTVTFHPITITIQKAMGEGIPIDSEVGLIIFSNPPTVVRFDLHGNIVSKEGPFADAIISVVKRAPPTLPSYGYGPIYAYGYSYFYGYFKTGYGYGYFFDGVTDFVYQVNINPSKITPGRYGVLAKLITSLVPDTFTSFLEFFEVFTPAPPPTAPPPPPPPPPPPEKIVENPKEAARDLAETTPDEAAKSLRKALEIGKEKATETFSELTKINIRKAAEIVREIAEEKKEDAATFVNEVIKEDPRDRGPILLDSINFRTYRDIQGFVRDSIVSQILGLPFPPNIAGILGASVPPAQNIIGTIIKTVDRLVFAGVGRGGLFNRFGGSPEPFVAGHVKFLRDIPEVNFDVRILAEKPANIPIDVPPNLKVHSYIDITMTGARDEDIDVAQIEYKVEKSWMEANNIKKLSISLLRFDPDLKDWIPLSTFISDEDDQFVYYLSSTPKLSTFALTGSETFFPLAFKYFDLTITPKEIPFGDKGRVTVNVTNIAKEPVTQVVDLYLDNVVFDSTILSLRAGESKVISFDISSDIIGEHTVRVGYLEESFKVGLPGIKTTTITPKIFDVKGVQRLVFKAKEPITMTGVIENKVPLAIDIAFFVQIKNTKGEVVFLGATPSKLDIGGIIRPSFEFTLTQPDKYTVEFFVWDKLIDPTPLAEVAKVVIEVTEG
ncbi:MAG: PGF-pre-PGF domain-containing protein [Nitrososphaerales archaeon]